MSKMQRDIHYVSCHVSVSITCTPNSDTNATLGKWITQLLSTIFLCTGKGKGKVVLVLN